MYTVHGIDFTSSPRRRKPIAVATGTLSGDLLRIHTISTLVDFGAFEAFLNTPGPWLAALDFPFGQPLPLIREQGWGPTWADLIDQVEALDQLGFGAALTDYRQRQPAGSKEPPRAADRAAGSASAMKLFNPPVGWMFWRGAPRLRQSGVHVIPCHPTGDARIAVEAYPALVARAMLNGRRESYKSDTRAKQTEERRSRRAAILDGLSGTRLAQSAYALRLELPVTLAQCCLDDASGDTLDSVLAAIQAGYARRAHDQGWLPIPGGVDPIEGWICDPTAGP